MGKVCVSHDTLLITDDDSTTQDYKSLPPCMQLQAGVGFNFLPSNTNPPPRLQLRDRVGFFPPFFSSQRTTTTTTSHVGSLSSSVSVCTHDNVDNPPPRLQLRDGVGFYHLFFQVNERQRRQPTPSLAIARRGGFLLSFFSFFKATNDDDDDEPCRLVVACLHLYPRKPNNPPPRLQLRDGVGFLSSFFLSQRTPTTTTSHAGSLSSSAACLRLHSRSSPSLAAPPHLRMRVGGVI